MKNYIIKLLVFMLAISGSALLWADDSETSVQIRDWNDLQTLMDEDADFLLLDVRTPQEYQSGHIPGALLLPYTDIPENPPEAAKDSVIVLYCRSGSRAEVANQMLSSMGFTNVINFGGISRWGGKIHYGDQP